MNILITGTSGFIGKALKNELNLSHKVYSTDIILPVDKTNFFHIDLLKPENIEGKIIDYNIPQIDVIIHCASILANSQNHKNIELLYQNLKITESLINIARILKPTKIINFSTIGVYPNIDGVFSEESKVCPSKNYEAIYSLSKFCSEELIAFLCKNTKVINLRNAQTIGEGMRNDRIYSILLKELKESNTISVWGNGERISAFISIDYLVRTVKKILYKKDMEGTFNLGEKNITYLQMAKEIIEKYGTIDSQIILIDKGNQSKTYIEFNKINKELNI